MVRFQTEFISVEASSEKEFLSKVEQQFNEIGATYPHNCRLTVKPRQKGITLTVTRTADGHFISTMYDYRWIEVEATTVDKEVMSDDSQSDSVSFDARDSESEPGSGSSEEERTDGEQTT